VGDDSTEVAIFISTIAAVVVGVTVSVTEVIDQRGHCMKWVMDGRATI